MTDFSLDRPVVSERRFQSRTQVLSDLSSLSSESQAAIRQFSVHRLTSYGLAQADAHELLERVYQGQVWMTAALDLARECLAPKEASMSKKTEVGVLFRTAALSRAAQMMMIQDDEVRHDLFANAAGLYDRAAQVKGDRSRYEIDATGGRIVAWRFPARVPRVATAMVFGGIEGWAMDFAALGEDLAARGIEAHLIDGPGQGESRFRYHTYLSRDWQSSYRDIVGHVAALAGDTPLFIVGNSMGGCLVMNYAATDTRISGICSNGGPRRPPELAGELPSKIKKFHVFCGDVPVSEAAAIWGDMDAAAAMSKSQTPLLIVHGGRDPFVEAAELDPILAGGPDRTMVTFSDGEHCIYNHPEDKHDLIGDWILARAAS